MTRRGSVAGAVLVALLGPALFAPTPCEALAGWSLGFKAGAGRSHFTGALGDSLHRAATGIAAGACGTIWLGTTLALQPELLYVTKGARFDVNLSDPYLGDFGPIDESLILSYLEIPVLLRARLGSRGPARPYLVAGSAFDIKLDARFGRGAFTGREGVDPALVRDRDVGMVAGAGLDWVTPRGPVSFELRYAAGTMDALDGRGTPAGRNGMWTLTVAFPLVERPASASRSP